MGIIFLTIFLDAVGIGLIFPILSPLLLDNHLLLSPSTTATIRTCLVGVIVSFFTLAQFFSAPLLGALSDAYGRKKIILTTLLLTLFSYLLGGISIKLESLSLLILSRILTGTAAGNAAVAEASMADITQPNNKAKYFGYIGMSFGLGFIIGPWLGGKLSNIAASPWLSYASPFWGASVFTLINFLLALFFFKETRKAKSPKKFRLFQGIDHLRKAMASPHLKKILWVVFIFYFGWQIFCVFIPIFLINHLHFLTKDIGNFYAYLGFFFALGSGVFMRLFSKVPLRALLMGTLPLLTLYMMGMLWMDSKKALLFYLPFLASLAGIVFATTLALVSNLSDKKNQGETFGIYQSVQSAALAIPPFIFGPFVAKNPYFAILGTAFFFFIASGMLWLTSSPKLEKQKG